MTTASCCFLKARAHKSTASHGTEDFMVAARRYLIRGKNNPPLISTQIIVLSRLSRVHDRCEAIFHRGWDVFPPLALQEKMDGTLNRGKGPIAFFVPKCMKFIY